MRPGAAPASRMRSWCTGPCSFRSGSIKAAPRNSSESARASSQRDPAQRQPLPGLDEPISGRFARASMAWAYCWLGRTAQGAAMVDEAARDRLRPRPLGPDAPDRARALCRRRFARRRQGCRRRPVQAIGAVCGPGGVQCGERLWPCFHLPGALGSDGWLGRARRRALRPRLRPPGAKGNVALGRARPPRLGRGACAPRRAPNTPGQRPLARSRSRASTATRRSNSGRRP